MEAVALENPHCWPIRPELDLGWTLAGTVQPSSEILESNASRVMHGSEIRDRRWIYFFM